MSKRLNKRQQRELEELQQLKAVQDKATKSSAADDALQSEEEEEDDETPSVVLAETGTGPVNPFAALGAGEPEAEDDDDEEEAVPTVSTPKKTKKKKSKKKKSAAATPALAEEEEDADGARPSTATPAKAGQSRKGAKGSKPGDAGLDEVDQALAELDLKYGTDTAATSASRSANAAASSSTLGFRQLLAVYPKNLDADAELRRFFGSKVISASAATSKSHRPTASGKLRYTISKPKPTYPPATSLAGLGMRELSDDEVQNINSSRLSEWRDPAEKWFSFEHSGVWREITRQFLGATQSHDIGAASDYAERALYALDRCLIPAFNVSSGACRLDFNRVENRPMFMALHRIISYLGRRGCWVTAFNFAKLLFSLDPMNDPHGAAFWLDFLAIKSGNHAWLLSMFEEQGEQFPAAVFQGYPGMAFAYALACRAREDAEKSKDRVRSDHALREAILAFPQAVIPLADKIGANIPNSARTNPLLQIQAGYSTDPLCAIHLLSHIYASRSEALWKEAPIQAWFEQGVSTNLPDMHQPDAMASREDVLRLIQTPRDPFDEQINIPLFICRHVLCSESTSFVGFLPSVITSRSFNAYDPVPPLTSTSSYNNEYFAGLQPSRRSTGRFASDAGGGGAQGMMGQFMNRVFAAAETNPGGWREELMNGWRQAIRGGGGAAALRQQLPEGEQEEALRQMMQLAEDMVQQRNGGEQGAGEGGMPGAFPGT